MIKRSLLLFFFFPWPLAAALPQKDLARDPSWLALLHMEWNLFGLKRSAIDDPSFFLSPHGQRDPEAELEATLTAFAQPFDKPDDAAACRYPARRAWLEEKLQVSFEPPSHACARFQEWKRKLAPSGVSMIFASYYFNNPASMYGHTFLKLSRRGYEPGKGLLDYTVNYAAQANTGNGFLFALNGLCGGYKGRFATDPYYMKIQKYNNLESRDLWEYDLNLSTAEVDRLVAHLWEVGPAAIRYYFFNKNCSYQLLPVLEAARPSLNMSRRFRFRTIPLDTIHAVLEEPGFASPPRLRPSHVRLMLARRSLLTPDEARTARALGLAAPSHMEELMKPVPAPRQSLVLDAAFDYFRFKTGFVRERPDSVVAREQKLLLLRKDASGESPDNDHLPLGEVARPESGHATAQLALQAGADRRQGFEEVGLRAALHDQESDSTGYVPGSQLEMLHFIGRFYNDDARVRLEKATLVEIFSLSRWDPWVRPPSWRLWAGADVAHDLTEDARKGLDAGLKGGSGFTWGLFGSKSQIFYVMWRAEGAAGDVFDKGYRIGAGGQSGILIPIAQRVRFHFSGDALRFVSGNVGNLVRLNGTMSVSLKKNLELRLSGERQNHYREARGGLFIYW